MKVYVDGSGKGDYCFLIEDTNTVRKFHGDGLTNNQAEYYAIIAALGHLHFSIGKPKEKETVEVFSDSRLAVNQLNFDWQILDTELRRLAMKVWSLVETLAERNYSVVIRWIHNKENKAGKILG